MWSLLRRRTAVTAAAAPAHARRAVITLAAEPAQQRQRRLHIACARCAAAAASSQQQPPPSGGGNSYPRPMALGAAEPQLQRAPADARPDTLLRDRPAPSSAPSSSELTVAAQQAREMDRATKAARAARMRARKSGSDWRERMDSRRSRESRIPVPLAPPIYYPAPFASLPVIPSARETLESALIRVDKVPKSPGFGKEVSRIRGQLAKYNFTARRQLEVAEEEMATKLQARIDAFPRLRKQLPRSSGSGSGSGEEAEAQQQPQQTASHDPFAPQLHPYDHSLIAHSLSPAAHRGAAAYTALLNHAGNLVQKLRGAAALGLKGLNHSKNMSDSRKAHTDAILRMKSLWTTGDAAGQASDGGSGQKSGMQLVEGLRALSKQLRHIPTIDFDRNLLDVKRNVASYLSVLPPALLFLPEEQLTFEALRPYLPPSPTYTFSLVGAPNVGKSSLLRVLSRAKVEVRNFAFTTTALQVGHLERPEQQSPSMLRPEALTTGAHSAARRAKEGGGSSTKDSVYPQPAYTPAIPLTRVQLVDTPGLLFRPDVLRKSVEHLTLSLCAHINPLILAFVIDETGTSGSGVRTQRFLLRELRQRFSFHTPPHPLASDTDPRNHAAHDALYANVAADPELQSLTHRLQRIPWVLLRSKSDVLKRDRVADEVLARATKGAEKEVRIVEAELREHNRAVIEEQDAEEDESAEAGGTDPASSPASSRSSDLAVIPAPAPMPNPRVDRPAWKLEMIRQHMHRYLAARDGSGAFDTLGEEGLEAAGEGLTAGRGRAAAAVKQIGASFSDSSASDDPTFSSSPASLPLPSLSVSADSGRGLAELEAHIWFEVDRRESLRLERAYKEMKKRIIWATGRGGGSNHSAQIEGMEQQQLLHS